MITNRTLTKLLCTTLIVFQASTLRAQALIALIFGDKLVSDKMKMGLYLAPQYTWLSNTPGGSGDTGLGVGAYTDIIINDKWMISNTMSFKAPKGGEDLPTSYTLVADADYPAEGTIRRKLTYFELVPMLRYNVTPSWSVAAGPQIGIKLRARDYYHYEREDGSLETVRYNTGSYFKTFDFGGGIDLQYALKQGKGVHINLRYVAGFMNIYKNDVPFNAKNNYFQIGVGIPIQGDKKVQKEKTEN
ncbi:outer membrane beta-barrel protein [Flavobacterium sp. RHBU_3]|uniref:outer membrane beta-barrel protein n=1 Tax=Flavobacterium sp. RHBU_3 TaxID=3391184 RepID=UPI003984AF5E